MIEKRRIFHIKPSKDLNYLNFECKWIKFVLKIEIHSIKVCIMMEKVRFSDRQKKLVQVIERKNRFYYL